MAMMTPSVCRTCFNTCDPETNAAECFAASGNTGKKGVPKWKASGAVDEFWDPMSATGARSDWETDWVTVQKANKNAQ